MMNIFSKSEIQQKIFDFYDQNSKGVLEILGPTASGKTSFTVELAHLIKEKLGKTCEIIVVDSRQVYRECDVSSVKISESEMEGIVHHGLDLISLNQDFSVYDFQQYAFGKIKEIFARGHLPILSGGTMMWLDSISENYVFLGKGEKSDQKLDPLWPFLKVGIHWDREVLYERINKRAVGYFGEGLLEETQQILKKYPLDTEDGQGICRQAFTSFGYREIASYLAGEITFERALELNQQRNRNYAKKQLTWWRGREDVVWVNGGDI